MNILETAQPTEMDLPVPEAPKAESSWEMWSKNPTPANLSSVLRSIDPVISGSISRYPNISPSLLRSESKRLAIQAVKSYKPGTGASLSTHVFGHLRPLGRFAERTTRVINVPRDFKTEVASLVRARQDFMESEGREPSDSEIQDILGVSKSKLRKLNAGAFYELPEGQVEGDIDVEGSESPELNLWTEYVYHDLPERDRMIMDHRLGRNGRPILEPNQIAQVMGIDPSYVRKRTTAISKKILEGLNSKNL
jgi:DNA-directed RNA polymerase specialized sigma subunit